MKTILQRLANHETLSTSEAKVVLTNITQEKYNTTQVASFITVFLMRGITADELNGFREALMDLCVRVDVSHWKTIDVCGTGGDGKDTFNISTLSAFIVAGAGYKVVKHGNKSVSSQCGSSDVLSHLGLNFSNDPDQLKRRLEENNFCYLHAPLFHPALKSVGPIRKDLGLKTFFNMLGPLVNPCQPSHQLVGVFSLKLMRLYNSIFDTMGHNYSIVHGLNGYDEISLTDDTKVISSNKGTYLINHEHFGFPKLNQSDIFGGNTIEEAKDIFLNVLNNKSTNAQRNVVLSNSAMGIDCFKEKSDIKASLEEATVSLDSGKAVNILERAIELSK